MDFFKYRCNFYSSSIYSMWKSMWAEGAWGRIFKAQSPINCLRSPIGMLSYIPSPYYIFTAPAPINFSANFCEPSHSPTSINYFSNLLCSYLLVGLDNGIKWRGSRSHKYFVLFCSVLCVYMILFNKQLNY